MKGGLTVMTREQRVDKAGNLLWEHYSLDDLQGMEGYHVEKDYVEFNCVFCDRKAAVRVFDKAGSVKEMK